MSNTIVEHVDVGVPVQVAYDQWTQFETFPEFMIGVRSVEQLDDRQMRWTADIAGEARSWRAEITEQIPDQRIAWRAVGDVHHAGVVTFHRLTDHSCRVTLQMELEPDRLVDRVAHVFGIDQIRIKDDLARFQRFIELRGTATGSWRGTIDADGHVTPDPRGPRRFDRVSTEPGVTGERMVTASPMAADRMRDPLDDLAPMGSDERRSDEFGDEMADPRPFVDRR